MTRIGGQLDWRALAEQHRPRDPDAISAEARRLQRELGLTAQDIAQALRISPAVAHEALREDGSADA